MEKKLENLRSEVTFNPPKITERSAQVSSINLFRKKTKETKKIGGGREEQLKKTIVIEVYEMKTAFEVVFRVKLNGIIFIVNCSKPAKNDEYIVDPG